MLDVDAERDELDPRPALAEPAPKLLDLAPAVRDDRVQLPEGFLEETLRRSAPELREPLRKADRRVHDRPPHAAEPSEERERDADRVDGGEDDIGAVRCVERGQHAREVARVPPAEAHGAVEDACFGTLACIRLEAGLEVVTDLEAAAAELVEPVQAVPRRDPPRAPAAPPVGALSRGRGRRRSPRLG